MSKEIDERIVSMQFDNKNFEANVKTSMKTVDAFNEKLKFEGVEKGFQKIENASSKVNLGGMSKAVETVQAKFSALDVMGATVIANLTNTALAASKRILSSLTIDPVKTGFNEYELKMGAIQTIMASTGESLDVVKTKLEDLNKYSDETIYSFSDMTTNIGKFTNAGIKLDDSVMAIKGISNAAALSGANANEASRAMYNFSQALSSGAIKVTDWKSIESANMATVEFKNQLLESAAATGSLTKQANGMYKTVKGDLINATTRFNETLEQGWMTSESLIKTLKNYADETTDIGKRAYEASKNVKTFTQMLGILQETAQSGWAQTWELVVGDYSQAKKMFSAMTSFFGGIIGKVSDTRNAILGDALNSGWDKFGKTLEKTGISMSTFKTELSKTAELNNNSILSGMIKKTESMDKLFTKGFVSSKMLIETIKRIGGEVSNTTAPIKTVTANVKELSDVVNKVIRGDFGNGAARVAALTKAGYDYKTVQSLVNQLLYEGKMNFDKLSVSELKNMGYTEEQVKAIKELAAECDKTGSSIDEVIQRLYQPSGKEHFFSGISNIVKAATTVVDAFKQAWASVFEPADGTVLYSLLAGFDSLTSKLTGVSEHSDEIQRTFKGLFSIISLVSEVVHGVFSAGFKAASKVLGLFNLDLWYVTASIGDVLTGVKEYIDKNKLIVTTIDKVADAISLVILTVGKFFKTIYELPVVQKYITNLFSTFQNGFASLGSWLSNAGNWISSFVGNVKSIDDLKIFKFPKTFSKSIGVVSDSVKLIGASSNRASTAVEVLSGTISTATSKMTPAVSSACLATENRLIKFGKFLTENIGQIIAVGFSAVVLKIGWNISKFLQSLSAPVEAVTGLISKVGSVFSGLSKNLLASADKKKAESILAIAEAIGILAASLFLISKIDSTRLWASLGALSALTLMLMGLSKVTKSEVANGLSIGSPTIKAILGLAIGILLIGKSLDQISNIKPERLESSILTFYGIISALTLSAIVLSEYSKKVVDIKSTALNLVAIGGAVLLVSNALTNLSKIPADRVSQVLEMTALIFIGLIGLSTVAKKCSRKIGTLSISMLAIVGSIILFSSSADKLSKVNAGNLVKAYAVMASMIIAITILSKVTSKISPDIAKVGVMMIGLSVSMLLLIGACKLLGMFKPEELVKGVATIGVLALIFGAVSALSKFAGPNAMKAGVMMLAMAAAVTVLSMTAIIVGNIKKDKVEQGVAAISTLMRVMGLVIAASALAKDCMGTMIAISSGLAVLVIGLSVLSLIDDPSKIRNGVIALGAVMGLMGLLMYASSKMTTSLAPLIALTAAIAVIAGIIVVLSNLAIDPALSAIAGISILMLSASASVLILSNASDIIARSLIALGVVTVIVGVLAFIISALTSSCDPTGAIETSVGLSVLILALAGACSILTIAGAAAPAALAGVGVLCVLILGIIGLVLVMGALAVGLGALMTTFPDVEKFLNVGLPLLQRLAKSFGEFFGNIVAGFADAAMSSLPSIATTFSQFMDNIQPFLTSLNAVDSNVVVQAAAVAGAITAICTASVIDAITSFFTGDDKLKSFVDSLKVMGDGLVSFASSTTGLDVDKVKKSADAFLALSLAASKIPNSGDSVAKFFAGDNNIADFGVYLEEFGASLVKYAGAVAELNSTKVDYIGAADKAVSILTGISAAAKAIPNEGDSVAKFFAGDNNIADFGFYLEGFGASIVTYAGAVAKLNSTKVNYVGAADKAASILTGISAAAKAIPNEGDSVAKFFAGDNNIKDFGKGLVSFGESITDFANSVATLDSGDTDYQASITNVCTMIDSLSEATSKISNEGGLAAFFAGDNTISKIGTGLGTFADSLVWYVNKISELDDGVVNNAAACTTSIVSSFSAFKDFETFKGFEIIGSVLRLFGDGVKSYYDDIKKMDPSKFNLMNDTIIEAITKIVKMELPTNTPDVYLKVFETLGVKGIDQYAKSLGDGKETVRLAMLPIFETVSQELKKIESEFENAGYFAGKGFVNGLKTTSVDMQTEVSNFGGTAVKTLKKELDEHSPSKITEEIGKFFGEGFPIGLEKSVSGAKAKVSSFANTMIDTFKTNMSGVGGSSLFDVSSMGLNGQNSILEQMSSANALLGKDAQLSNSELEDAQNKALMAQDNYWTRLLKIKQTGIDAEKYKSMTYLDFQKDTLDQVKSVWDEYSKALDSKRESIFGQVGIFEAITEKEKVDSRTLMDNMRSQLSAYARYKTVLTELNSKIDNKMIRDMINGMGVNDLDKLEAINGMGSAELGIYTSMIEEKYRISAETAYETLTDLRTETESKLGNILGGIDVNADDFIANFDGTLESLDAYVYKVVDKMVNVGKQMVAGVAKGVKDNKDLPNKAIEDVITSVADSAQAKAEIHSPSKLMANTVGAFLTAGIASGISNSSSVRKAIGAMQDVISSIASSTDSTEVKKTLDGLFSSAIDYVSDDVSGMVISPVLDLTNIQNGSRKIKSLFGTSQRINVSGDYGVANHISTDNANGVSNRAPEVGNTYIDKSVHLEQTNTSPKALSAAEIRWNTVRSLQLMNLGV